MKVRRAGVKDIAEVITLAMSISEVPQWTQSQFESFVQNEKAFFLIAEDQGRISGFAAISSLRLPGELIAQLESIAVAPKERGKGIGLLLLRHALLRLAMESAGQMELEVRSRNEAAIALYRKAGFVEQGGRPGYYADPPDDALLMVLHFPQAIVAE